MQLSSVYSSSCGLKIEKPYIYEVFFPFTEEDFITIDTSEGTYSYWSDVILLIAPYLKEKNINIFQLGVNENPSLPFVKRTNGTLSAPQKSYLLKRSKLHITTNNFSAQLCAYLNKNLICITDDPSRTLAFDWGDPKAHSFIYPQSQDFIEPERLAELILQKLKINFNFKYETLFVGEKYKDGVTFCEMVPTKPISLQALGMSSILARMDLHFSEEVLQKQLEIGKVSIYTDRPIDINIIRKFQENIIEVVYEVKEKNHPEFCEEVKKLGIQCNLVSFLSNEKINEQKLKYMDINNIIPQKTYSLDDVAGATIENVEKLFFKSKRYIVKHDTIYLSEESLKMGVKSNNSNDIQKVINNKEFWSSLDALTILKKID
jgi:hypothetical protein